MASLHSPVRRRARLIVGALSVLGAVALWQMATAWPGWIKPLFLASPAVLWDAFAGSLREPYGGATLAEHVLVSLGEVLVGFAGGIAVGIPLGVAMAWSPVIGRMMSPFFNTIRQIPPLAWVPLAVVWFGIGFAPKAFVIFIAAVVPSTINAFVGVRMVDVDLLNAARVFGARGAGLLWQAVVPSAAPLLFTGVRLSLQISWTTVVAAELLASSAGLGFMMVNASRNLQPEFIMLSMAMIGLLGALMTQALERLQAWLITWQEPAHE
ncbi:MAG TPA: ABC transporter permease [Methylomirabilota bacterium]|jgi:NitT/TauT family transport system permease protein/taurine transport system permease protein|nr:ABC transporter permease [Methylomirabilota bacterium]